MLVDTHAHLEALENLEEVLAHAKSVGLVKIITIGTSLASSKKAIEIAEKYTTRDLKIFATVGIHPYDGKDDVENDLDAAILELKEIASTSKKVVGIGECGLDYYEQGEKRKATSDNEKEFQRKLFRAQIKLAAELNLPLVVHCRDAWDEMFDLLTRGNWSLKNGVVFHSFTGTKQDAEAVVALGGYVSFSGIVTFKSAAATQEAARCMPIDRMLLETDSPFLSPEPFRGQKNEPANVKIIADFLAKACIVSLDDVSAKTSANAQRVFKL